MKPLAPLGEWLRRRILSGQREIAIIFMGRHAKERALSIHTDLPCTLYLPYGTSPCAFAWPVHGCEVYVADTSFSSSSFIKHLGKTLYSSGVTLIHYSSINQRFDILNRS